MVTSWNQDFVEIRSVKQSKVLKTILKEKVIGESFAFYNVYGPYHNIKVFWEAFFSSGLLEPKNMTLEGDLNLTISEKENWGAVGL